jgi:hypothetical protein
MFAAPLGLLALLALPAVLALHLFRRRFRVQEVSALFLWGQVERQPLAGRQRERLVRSASLWLELFGALALGLALAGPRCGGPVSVPHLVAVIDGSASMLAVGAKPSASTGSDDQRGGTSAVELANAELRRRIADLGADARVTLIRSGPHPEVLCGPRAAPGEAREALAGPAPALGDHDLGPALELALELADGGRVLALTDRTDLLPELPGIEHLALGRPSDNAAILRAVRESSGTGRERLTLVVAQFGANPLALNLQVRPAEAGAAALYQGLVEFGSNERQSLSLELAASASPLELTLANTDGSAPDAFALDDRVLIAPPDSRPVLGWIELDPASRSSLGDPGQDGTRLLAAMDGALAANSPAEAEVAIVSAGTPGLNDGAMVLELHTPSGELTSFLGPYLVERAHPLLEGLGLEGVVWSAATAFPRLGSPLVSAGDTPLILEERRGRGRRLLLNLDATASNFGRTPDWPILLFNLASAAREARPGANRRHLAPGQELVLRGIKDKKVQFRGPGFEQELQAKVEDVTLPAPPRPGLYQLTLGDAPPLAISVALEDAAESDLRRRSNGQKRDTVAEARIAGERGTGDLLLVLLALALLGADWFVLRPRAGSTQP